MIGKVGERLYIYIAVSAHLKKFHSEDGRIFLCVRNIFTFFYYYYFICLSNNDNSLNRAHIDKLTETHV